VSTAGGGAPRRGEVPPAERSRSALHAELLEPPFMQSQSAGDLVSEACIQSAQGELHAENVGPALKRNARGCGLLPVNCEY